jgi:hypothetical protein
MTLVLTADSTAPLGVRWAEYVPPRTVRKNRLKDPSIGYSDYTGSFNWPEIGNTYGVVVPSDYPAYPGSNGQAQELRRELGGLPNVGTSTTATVDSTEEDVWTEVHVLARVKAAPGAGSMEVRLRSNGVTTKVTVPEDGAWHEVDFIAPREAGSRAGSFLEIVSLAAPSGSGVPLFLIDSALVEFGTTGGYFDGDTPDTADSAYAWTFTQFNSPSTETPL